MYLFIYFQLYQIDLTYTECPFWDYLHSLDSSLFSLRNGPSKHLAEARYLADTGEEASLHIKKRDQQPWIGVLQIKTWEEDITFWNCPFIINLLSPVCCSRRHFAKTTRHHLVPPLNLYLRLWSVFKDSEAQQWHRGPTLRWFCKRRSGKLKTSYSGFSYCIKKKKEKETALQAKNSPPLTLCRPAKPQTQGYTQC